MTSEESSLTPLSLIQGAFHWFAPDSPLPSGKLLPLPPGACSDEQRFAPVLPLASERDPDATPPEGPGDSGNGEVSRSFSSGISAGHSEAAASFLRQSSVHFLGRKPESARLTAPILGCNEISLAAIQAVEGESAGGGDPRPEQHGPGKEQGWGWQVPPGPSRAAALQRGNLRLAWAGLPGLERRAWRWEGLPLSLVLNIKIWMGEETDP